jgi:hypothetical protein
VSYILTQLDDVALDVMENSELPPEAELFAQLASQATEALLLNHRAVQMAEAMLAARVGGAPGPTTDVRRNAHDCSPPALPTLPCRKPRECFDLRT